MRRVTRLVAGPAHGPADEDEHVGGGRAVGGDDEVGVDIADPGPAGGLALHAEQLHDPAGGHLGRVGEHAAAVGLVHRLVVAPPAAGLVDLGPDGGLGGPGRANRAAVTTAPAGRAERR